MMAVAGAVGRADAHALVSEASSAVRGEGVSLQEALERVLGPEFLEASARSQTCSTPPPTSARPTRSSTAALEGWARGSSARLAAGGWNSSTVMPSGSLR